MICLWKEYEFYPQRYTHFLLSISIDVGDEKNNPLYMGVAVGVEG